MMKKVRLENVTLIFPYWGNEKERKAASHFLEMLVQMDGGGLSTKIKLQNDRNFWRAMIAYELKRSHTVQNVNYYNA